MWQNDRADRFMSGCLVSIPSVPRRPDTSACRSFRAFAIVRIHGPVPRREVVVVFGELFPVVSATFAYGLAHSLSSTRRLPTVSGRIVGVVLQH